MNTKQAKIIAVANQKGGVGKTTTCVTLGVALATLGKKVLLVDVDPQSHVAKSFGYNKQDYYTISKPLKQILNLEDLEYNTDIHHEIANIDLILSDLDLSTFEIEMVAQAGSDHALKLYLEPLTSQYDYILIDCPPSLPLLSINAFTASDYVIIPLQADEYAIDGLNEVTKSIYKVKRFLNPNIEILGLVVTMVDTRTNHSKDMEQSIRNSYSSHLNVFKSYIPRSIRMGESVSNESSIHTFEPNGATSKAYVNLAKEVVAHGE